jgi:hypothetical protein
LIATQHKTTSGKRALKTNGLQTAGGDAPSHAQGYHHRELSFKKNSPPRRGPNAVFAWPICAGGPRHSADRFFKTLAECDILHSRKVISIPIAFERIEEPR